MTTEQEIVNMWEQGDMPAEAAIRLLNDLAFARAALLKEAIRERDAALAQAEVAERRLADVRVRLEMLHSEALDDLERCAAVEVEEYYIGYEEGLSDTLDVIEGCDASDVTRQWRRKPITHEWSGIVDSPLMPTALGGWAIGTGILVWNGQWVVPLSRPIHPINVKEVSRE